MHQLMHALIVLAVLPGVFRARQLRSLLGNQPTIVGQYTPGRTTYDLRRLRLHGVIERIPGRLAYRVTDRGLSAALFYTHAYDTMVAPGFADLNPDIAAASTPLRKAAAAFSRAWDQQLGATLRGAA